MSGTETRLPIEVQHVAWIYNRLQRTRPRSEDGRHLPILFSEIKAWGDLHGGIAPWEVSLLVAIDEEQLRGRPPPLMTAAQVDRALRRFG